MKLWNRTSRIALCGLVSALAILLMPSFAMAADGVASKHCPAFETSEHYREPRKTLVANTRNWKRLVKKARAGDQILLENGVYKLKDYALVLNKKLTLRSKSGNPKDVIIQGVGYHKKQEALMVMADDVQIADITVRNVADHAVAVKADVSGTFLYNLELHNIGTGHIKGSKLNGDGTIACSKLGFSNDGILGSYTGAIDLQFANGWSIRDNYFYNIWGDGSGCYLKNRDCGKYEPGGKPAILLWRSSKDNIIERNVFINSYRPIALGLNTSYDGGIVRDNLIINIEQSRETAHGEIEPDAGISLLPANNVLVENNAILVSHDYPGQIEVRKSKGNTIRNNIISKPIWDRGNSEYNGCGSATRSHCKVDDPINTLLDPLTNARMLSSVIAHCFAGEYIKVPDCPWQHINDLLKQSEVTGTTELSNEH